MNLLECLKGLPYRALIGIARTHRLSVSDHMPKTALVELLVSHLGKPRVIKNCLAALPPDAHTALQRLVAHGGMMLFAGFVRVFGPIRPWGRHASPHAWRVPISTSEQLLYSGLIYPLPAESITLPVEFNGLIPLPESHLSVEPTASAEPSAAQRPFDPVLDLAFLLAYLQQHDIQPLHGRWLSMRHLKRLGSCLYPPESYRGVSSERHAGRLAFIHCLAEALYLILPPNPWLKPGPDALAWLSLPRSVQLRRVWVAWLQPDDANRQRWSHYRLPCHDLHDPFGLVQRLATLLLAHPVGVWLPCTTLFHHPLVALDDLVPWWEHEEHDTARQFLPELLAGPLRWLGVVEVRSDPDQPGSTNAAAPPATSGRMDGAISHWRLTPLGAWMLDETQSAPPDDRTSPLILSGDLDIHLPPDPNPAALLALSPWTAITPGGQLQLSRQSIASSLEHGAQIQDLFSVMSRYVAPQLTPAQRDQLRDWAESLPSLDLHAGLLIQTSDPAAMHRLWHTRSIRAHLGTRLSDTLATIKTADPHAFIRVCRRAGFLVHNLPSPSAPIANNAAPTDAFWLAVIFRVYAHLARRFDIGTVPPAAILDRLIASLTPGTYSAVESAAAITITRLEQAIDGPPPVSAALSHDDLVERVIGGIQSGTHLRIRYWSAARGEVTERVVQPRELLWYGDRPTLIAFCHLRHEQRHFRLDRILDLAEIAGME